MWRCGWYRCLRTSRGALARFPLSRTFRGDNARDPRQIDAAVADSWCWRAEAEGEGHAVEAETEQRSRRRARQSIREYELICCCSSAYVQCLGLTGACAACSHCTATAWESSDLDHSHAATPRRVTRASCALVLRSVLLLGAACR